jgi:predicted nucleic acid-binding protein
LHGVDFDAVVRLALQHRLTTDDVSHLWLAPERNLPLATLDTQLDAAWKSIA